MRPVSFRTISPIAVNISKKEESKPPSAKIKKPVVENAPEAKLVIEINGEKSKGQKPRQDTAASATIPSKPKFTRIGSLEKIREKVAEENRNSRVVELNEEELYIAWGKYIDKLMETNKKPIISNFKTAKLNIVDENCIEIVTQTSLQQKFIEAERGELITHLQSHFNNRSLFYKLEVDPDEEAKTVKVEVLSTKQQYLRIIEQYPLVKQLKDKLGMQLDY